MPPGPGWLTLASVTRNNLPQIKVEFPLGTCTAVTGASGQGKSSLVSDALVDLVEQGLAQEQTVQDMNDPDDAQGLPREITQGRLTASGDTGPASGAG